MEDAVEKYLRSTERKLDQYSNAFFSKYQFLGMDGIVVREECLAADIGEIRESIEKDALGFKRVLITERHKQMFEDFYQSKVDNADSVIPNKNLKGKAKATAIKDYIYSFTSVMELFVNCYARNDINLKGEEHLQKIYKAQFPHKTLKNNDNQK